MDPGVPPSPLGGGGSSIGVSSVAAGLTPPESNCDPEDFGEADSGRGSIIAPSLDVGKRYLVSLLFFYIY